MSFDLVSKASFIVQIERLFGISPFLALKVLISTLSHVIVSRKELRCIQSAYCTALFTQTPILNYRKERKKISAVYSVAPLICTHYFRLSGQLDIFLGSGTLRKLVQNMKCKQQGTKNRLIVLKKEKRPGCLNNNDPVLLHPGFCTPCFGPSFFSGDLLTELGV